MHPSIQRTRHERQTEPQETAGALEVSCGLRHQGLTVLSERAQEHVYGSSLGRPRGFLVLFLSSQAVTLPTPPTPKLAARSIRRVGFAPSRVQARLLTKPMLAGPHQQDPSWAVLSRLMPATPAQGQVLQGGVTRETVQSGVLWLLASFAYPDVPCSVQPQGADRAPVREAQAQRELEPCAAPSPSRVVRCTAPRPGHSGAATTCPQHRPLQGCAETACQMSTRTETPG